MRAPSTQQSPAAGETVAEEVESVTREVRRTAASIEPTMVDVLAVLYGAKRTLILLAGLGAMVGVVVALLLPTVFRASTQVVASAQIESSSGGAGAGALMGAARQLGISLGSGGGGDPSALFVPILTSRRLAARVLETEFDFADGTRRTLRAHLATEAGNGEQAKQRAIDRFRKHVLRSGLSLESGVLTVSVLLDDPEAAAAVATRCVAVLDELNQEAKNAQASRWVEFIEERLAVAKTELTHTEEALKQFREQNRAVSDSPKLLLEQGRLMRDVEMSQQVFTTLRTQHELAKVEQMKNVPMLAVLDPAVPPTRKYKPRRTLVAAAGLLAGLAFGVVWVLGRRTLQQLRAHRVEPAAAA